VHLQHRRKRTGAGGLVQAGQADFSTMSLVLDVRDLELVDACGISLSQQQGVRLCEDCQCSKRDNSMRRTPSRHAPTFQPAVIAETAQEAA
jgi:hypothetical protein